MNTNHHGNIQWWGENVGVSEVGKESVNPTIVQFNYEGVNQVAGQHDYQEKTSEELTSSTPVYSYRTHEFSVKGIDIPTENTETVGRSLDRQADKSIFSTETIVNPAQDSNVFVFEPNSVVNLNSNKERMKVPAPTSKGDQKKYKRHDENLKKKFANLISKKGITPSFAADVLGIPRRTAYRWSKKEATASELRDNSEGSNEQPKADSNTTALSPIKNKHGHHRHDEKIKLGFIKLLKKMSASKAADALGVPRRTAHHWKIKYLGSKNDDLEISEEE